MFRPQYQLQKVSRQVGGKGYRTILNPSGHDERRPHAEIGPFNGDG